MANKKKTTEKKVSVKLDRISGQPEAVYVSVGKRSWRIKRGHTVEIPECAYEVLRNGGIAEDMAVAYIESL